MSVHTSLSRVVLPALLLSISLILLCLATSLCTARAQPSSKTSHVTLDSDPLRLFLPPSNLYMKVPGAHWVVEDAQDSNAHFEELRDKRNGGIVVGYCLRASCSSVTHLAVWQICKGRIGGPKGDQRLVLGVVRLPYGRDPGYLKALQGRNYAQNFVKYGPYNQVLEATDDGIVSSLYALWSLGMGAVQALEYLGLLLTQPQNSDSRTLHLATLQDQLTGVDIPRFEVRHLCQSQVS